MTVSIVIPAFNCGAYIERTLRSVQAQTHHDIEVLVVDDGSQDDTLSIAETIAAVDRRVRVITQPASGRASTARNTGIRSATGEFITFLDADDLFHPEKVSEQVRLFVQQPQLGVVFCDIAKFTDDATRCAQTGYLEGLQFLHMAASHVRHVEGDMYLCDERFYNFMSVKLTTFTTCTVMIRAAVLAGESHWFDEKLEIAEDVDLWFRLALRCRVGFVWRVLSYYRQRPGSLMSDPERVLRGAIAAHGTNLQRGRGHLSPQEAAVIEERVALQHALLGNLLLMKGEPAAARDEYRKSRSIDPTQSHWLAYAKTFVPRPLMSAARHVRRVVTSSSG